MGEIFNIDIDTLNACEDVVNLKRTAGDTLKLSTKNQELALGSFLRRVADTVFGGFLTYVRQTPINKGRALFYWVKCTSDLFLSVRFRSRLFAPIRPHKAASSQLKIF